MILIGDCHGRFEAYKKIIKHCTNSVQVGDMGIGFRRSHGPLEGEMYSGPPFDLMVKGNHRFIRGNHDNPGVCRKHKQWIADGTVENDVMFIGGAFSIDHMFRTEGVSWWRDEELSTKQADDCLTTFLVTKPRVMVTHDCPVDVVSQIHSHHMFDNSFTQQMLQNMFEQHQPDTWCFGHHHLPFDQRINGTRFICLPELETIDI